MYMFQLHKHKLLILKVAFPRFKFPRQVPDPGHLLLAPDVQPEGHFGRSSSYPS